MGNSNCCSNEKDDKLTAKFNVENNNINSLESINNLNNDIQNYSKTASNDKNYIKPNEQLFKYSEITFKPKDELLNSRTISKV